MRLQDNFRILNIRGTNLCFGNPALSLCFLVIADPIRLISFRVIRFPAVLCSRIRFPIAVRQVDCRSDVRRITLVCFQYRPIRSHVFDVVEGTAQKKLHHMGRHIEDAADFLNAILTG